MPTSPVARRRKRSMGRVMASTDVVLIDMGHSKMEVLGLSITKPLKTIEVVAAIKTVDTGNPWGPTYVGHLKRLIEQRPDFRGGKRIVALGRHKHLGVNRFSVLDLDEPNGYTRRQVDPPKKDGAWPAGTCFLACRIKRE